VVPSVALSALEGFCLLPDGILIARREIEQRRRVDDHSSDCSGSKPPEAYTHRTRTVEALEQATDAWNPQPGQHVEYVVVNDDARGWARVALPESADRYDTDFYTDLAVRAARSILAPLGWVSDDVREYLRATSQVTLGGF
jgi:DNA polymerase I